MKFHYTPSASEIEHKQRRREQRLADTEPAFRRPNQVLGQRSTIGCVALEITQRCNLDRTPVLPVGIFRVGAPPADGRAEAQARLRQGPLRCAHQRADHRRRSDAATPRRACRSCAMRPALAFIPRCLPTALRLAADADGARRCRPGRRRLPRRSDAGSAKGYTSEIQLNEVRQKYLERAAGLGIAVIFNTTVFQGNIAEIPELVRFFVRHAGALGMASFQMQADTGRGYLRKREDLITKQRICRLIEQGCGNTHLSWESVLFGHPECHNIAYTVVAGGQVIDLFDDVDVLSRWLTDFGTVALDRTQAVQSATRVLSHMLTKRPDWLLHGGAWAGRKLLKSRRTWLVDPRRRTTAARQAELLHPELHGR